MNKGTGALLTSGDAETIPTFALQPRTRSLYSRRNPKYPLVQSIVVSPPPGAVASAFAVLKIDGTTRAVSCVCPNGYICRTGLSVVSYGVGSGYDGWYDAIVDGAGLGLLKTVASGFEVSDGDVDEANGGRGEARDCQGFETHRETRSV